MLRRAWRLRTARIARRHALETSTGTRLHGASGWQRVSHFKLSS